VFQPFRSDFLGERAARASFCGKEEENIKQPRAARVAGSRSPSDGPGNGLDCSVTESAAFPVRLSDVSVWQQLLNFFSCESVPRRAGLLLVSLLPTELPHLDFFLLFGPGPADAQQDLDEAPFSVCRIQSD